MLLLCRWKLGDFHFHKYFPWLRWNYQKLCFFINKYEDLSVQSLLRSKGVLKQFNILLKKKKENWGSRCWLWMPSRSSLKFSSFYNSQINVFHETSLSAMYSLLLKLHSMSAVTATLTLWIDEWRFLVSSLVLWWRQLACPYVHVSAFQTGYCCFWFMPFTFSLHRETLNLR